MSRTIRVLYRGLQGRAVMNFSCPPITAKSAVVISAAEAIDISNGVGNFNGPEFDWAPHRGDADVYVTNIGPFDGHVEFILHVNWHAPLDVLVDIIVLDNREQFFAA